MALAPEIRRQQLKLKAQKLKHQSAIAESRESLRRVNEQLANLKPKPKEA